MLMINKLYATRMKIFPNINSCSVPAHANISDHETEESEKVKTKTCVRAEFERKKGRIVVNFVS